MQTNRCQCGAPLPFGAGVVRCGYCGVERFIGPAAPQPAGSSRLLLLTGCGCAVLLVCALGVGGGAMLLTRAQAPVIERAAADRAAAEDRAAAARHRAAEAAEAAEQAANAAEAARDEATRAQEAERARAPGESGAPAPSAGNARAALGTLDVRGSLSRDVVRRVIERHLSEVRGCYARSLAARADLEGQLTVSFIIGPDGAVRSAVVASRNIGHAPLEPCITQAVNRWTFPAPDGGVVGVTCPFSFSTAPVAAAAGRRAGLTIGAIEHESGAGIFDSRVVSSTLQTRRSAIERCYEAELQRDPGRSGRVLARFTVLESGATARASAIENGTGSAAIAECVLRALRTLRFNPGPEGGPVTYTFPFVFSPGAAGTQADTQTEAELASAIEAARAAGRTDSALAQMAIYVERFPQSPRARGYRQILTRHGRE